ncbi:carbohydrate ABC transporter substrate-binding protein (CUT1 family) [Kribbella amoyensis]|uniref:Carbohydrate ABC transporter substrate-binding protein (CUT1 family) n=1 Tax=Kribbella amoyensis TaxID=996641 RepID=A0A561BTK4_9ACTN|nr:sugar ABC transporter substrate-binding protein [Kribbella amoyensis]TWD82215.1 carbohydrate ABC transporter substrate-binding protein (CUT1 family) [Kribbella amoyensis]
MKRHLVPTLAAAAALALLTACGGGGSSDQAGDGPQTLKVALWNYATTPEFKAIIDGFQQTHPDIKVEPVDILADDYAEKVTTMLAGGDSTDVLTMKNVIDYSRFGTRGQLVPLTDEAKKLDATKYSGLDAYDLDGKYFALPYRQDFWVLYYNKTLLKQAGVPESKLQNLTWQGYAELAKSLTKGDGGSKVYGAYQHTWRSVVEATAAAQTGGDLLGGDYGFFKDQYQLTLDLQKNGALMPWATASSQKVTYNTMFSTGKAALMPMGTWYASTLLADTKSGKTKVEWGVAPLPQRAADGKVTTFGSPTAFAVNKNSKHTEAAKTFVEWASSEAGATAVAKAGVTPSLQDQKILDAYFALPGVPNDAIAKKAFKPDQVVLEMPVGDKSADVDQILTEEHELIMTGEKSLDDGLAEMSKRVKNEVG